MVELLKQPQYSPFPVEEQVVSIWAGTTGKMDDVPVEDIRRFEARAAGVPAPRAQGPPHLDRRGREDVGRHRCSRVTDADRRLQAAVRDLGRQAPRRRQRRSAPASDDEGRDLTHGSTAPGLQASHPIRHRDEEDHQGDGDDRRLAHRQGAARRWRPPRRTPTELTRAVTAVATGSTTKHPLTTEAEAPARAAVLLITSDRGLAGGYSSNAIKAAEQLAERLRGEGKEVDTYIVGRKGVAYYGFRERKVSTVVDRLHRQPDLRGRQAGGRAADRGHPDGDGRGRRGRTAHRLHGVRVDDDADAGRQPDAAVVAGEGSGRDERRRPRSFRSSTSSRRRRTSSTPCCRATSKAASTTRCFSRPLPSTPPAAVR